MFAPLRRMLHIEDDDLVGAFIDHIINDVRVGTGHELAHPLGLLQPSYTREQNQILQACIDRSPHAHGSRWVMVADIAGNGGNIFGCSPREAELHGSKRRNAASTSASVANSRRLA